MEMNQEKDVFVSYHMDSSEEIVQKICRILESRGISCWYASRDSHDAYSTAIVRAIRSCKVFLLILNENSNKSDHVQNEIHLAFNHFCHNKEMTLLPFRIDKCELSESVDYYLGRMRFMDGTMPPELVRIQELTDRITEVLGMQSSRSATIFGEGAIGSTSAKSYQIVSSMMYPDNQFVGRKRELQEVHDHLSGFRNKVFLVGMGGIGKSEIAKMYCKLHASDYDVVVWVPFTGSLLETLCSDSVFPIQGISRSDFAGLDDRTFFEKKLQILKTIADAKVLFVIDNFDVTEDPDLKKFCSGSYSVLFTTRYHQNEHSIPEVTISAFEEEDELLELFRVEYTRALDENALQIVKKMIHYLSGHTLSIRLVASTMQKQRMKPDKMLDLLKQGIGKVDEKNAKTTSHMLGQLRQVFNVTVLSEEELYLMKNLSLFSLCSVSVEQFYEWCELEDYDVIDELIRRSWVIHNPVTDEVHLHPLIADLFTEQVNEDPDCCMTLLSNYCKATEILDPISHAEKSHLLACGKAMHQRLSSQHPMSLPLQERMTACMFALSHYFESIENYKEMLTKGPDLEYQVLFYAKIAHIYALLKRSQESLDTALQGWELVKDRSVDSFSEALGYHWKLLIGRIGEAYRQLGYYTEAYQFQELELKYCHRFCRHGIVPQSSRAWALYHCATTLMKRNDPGDLEKAHDMVQEGIALLEEVNDDWSRSFSLDLRCEILTQWGRFEEALRLNQEAGQILLPMLGEEHIDVAKNITRRGHVYRAMGDVKQANEHYRRAAAIYHTNGAVVYEKEMKELMQE